VGVIFLVFVAVGISDSGIEVGRIVSVSTRVAWGVGVEQAESKNTKSKPIEVSFFIDYAWPYCFFLFGFDNLFLSIDYIGE
jgi:hypothetical protein